VDVRSSNTDNGLRIEVADTGIGIDLAHLPRLFEAFEQAGIEGVPAGLGTGLSLARPIIAMHKGTIFASSGGPNGGATFTIELPLLRENTTAPISGSTVPSERRGRLLVVEDHPDTLLVMARLLTSAGFQVTTASTVKEALHLAESNDFDLLLSDIGLPDGSGIDLMQQLKPKGVRGIALSGYGLDTDFARSRQAGFEHHLVKPIDFQNLTQSILKILPKSV
jgi:CheY-like chemotaxis protein